MTTPGLDSKSRLLPHITKQVFLTDGGLETTLIHLMGIDLPYHAAFPLLDSVEGRDALRGYYRRFIDIAERTGAGFVLESPTWRASSDWGAMLGYSPRRIEEVNRAAIELMVWLRNRFRGTGPVVISGSLGPRGEGYSADEVLTPAESRAYHTPQVTAFAESEVDIVSGISMTHIGEATGIALAAKQANLPVVISFTVNTTGRLPSGASLGQAIGKVDEATARYPLYYMIDSAHPEHFRQTLERGGPWVERVMGIRCNASKSSHSELDRMTMLDAGNPSELARDYATLRDIAPSLHIFGGSHGTDHRHVQAIAETCCN